MKNENRLTFIIKKVDNYYHIVDDFTDEIINIYYTFEDAFKDAEILNEPKRKKNIERYKQELTQQKITQYFKLKNT